MAGVQAVRLAGYQGASSILTAGLKVMADALSEGDRNLHPWSVTVEANVTASGTTAASLFRQLEEDDASIGYIASGYLGERVSELGVLDLPFSIASRAQALNALDGEAGRLLTAAVEKKTGYKVLGFWDNGFRHVSNSVRPIVTADDCRGLSIRTLDSANYRAALSALGFSPVSTDVKELVRVIESGELQAQENPLTNLLGFSLWKYHPFVSMTGHLFGVLLLTCRREWFEALSAERQQQLQSAAKKATAAQRLLAAQEDATSLERLRGLGIDVREAGVLDLSSMKAATRPLLDRASAALPAALLDAYLGAAPAGSGAFTMA
ncbi:MAG: TRAP transporter substrate-binding protein [Comamonadaceae bacterium]|nr:MAG: TRAP transporter substrate-binding protein [Comamonadaceae bacterium]